MFLENVIIREKSVLREITFVNQISIALATNIIPNKV